MTAEYDAAGRRTKLTWPDAFYVNYDYDTVGDMTAVRENGAASGIGVLAALTYDSLGNRVKLVRGNGDLTTYTPDPALPASRLSAQFDSLAGAATWNASRTFTYTPAGQLANTVRSNNLYGWTGHYNRADTYATNGLNQATAISGTSATTLTYDTRGNTTGIGTNAYGYSSENLLTSGPGGITLTYDPLLRLQKTSNGTSATWLLYDGDERTAEYSGSGALLRRYVYGPDTDEPLVWYEGSGTSDRRWLHADERGSVTAVSDASGNALAVNSYDEYGVPASTNLGKFGYTGQAWVPELGLWYYKARMYAPGLGRFLQTDPIGYGDGPNWYGYVGGDPVNASDPDGLLFTPKLGPDIIVNGFRFTEDAGEVDGSGGSGGIPGGAGQTGGLGSDPIGPDIVVHGHRLPPAPRPTPGRIQLLLNITQPQNDDIVVTANRHRYVLRYLNPCSASSVFGYFKQVGHSAPGAPAALEGFTGKLVLTGGNPISQYVNSSTGTIINTTLPGHRYFPGTVTIQVTPLSAMTSTTVITGAGTGAHSEENVILGEAFFGSQGAGAQTACGI